MKMIRFAKEYLPVGFPRVKFPKAPKSNIKGVPKVPKTMTITRLDRYIK